MSFSAMHSVVPEVPELTRQEKILTLLGVLLGLFLAALDQTIVATAGPAIQRDLHIEPSLYVWITTAYLVASTVLVPIYGKLSDTFGRKVILVTGILIFLAGSLLCGLAQSALQLILFRAVQGVGSAALFTSAFAVLADLFPPAERGKYQGLFGAVFGLSSVVGPLVGGFITDHLGWHWVFLINLPVGAVALAFIFARMPALRRPTSNVQPRIDVLGAVILVIALVPLLLALSLGKRVLHPGETGFLWGSWQILALFSCSAIALVAFVLVERRAADPILDLALFRNRVFARGNAATFIVGASFLGAIVFLPLFMVNVVGVSATESGLTIMPQTLGMVAGNILSGQLVARLGRYKGVLIASLILLAIGFAVMALSLTPDSTQAQVTVRMILIGIGLGPSIPVFTLAIQNAVPPERVGVATASATFFRQMGATIGIAILGTVFATSLSAEIHTRLQAATAELPPALAAQLGAGGAIGAGAAGAPAGEGGPGASLFDAGAARARVSQSFDARRAELERSLGQNPEVTRPALEQLEKERHMAMQGIDRVDRAFKQAFSDATANIYFIALGIALLGLLATLAMPDLPLRKRTQDIPQVLE